MGRLWQVIRGFLPHRHWTWNGDAMPGHVATELTFYRDNPAIQFELFRCRWCRVVFAANISTVRRINGTVAFPILPTGDGLDHWEEGGGQRGTNLESRR